MKRHTSHNQRRAHVPNHKKKVTANKSKKKIEKPPVRHEEPSGPDLINNLNDDCLARIFKYMSLDERLTMEAVCKRWKDVTKLAWDDIKTLYFTTQFTTKNDLLHLPETSRNNQCIGKIIKNCGRYLSSLHLAEPCNFRIFPIVAQHCPNLLRLEIELQHYDKVPAKLFSQIQKLKYLEIKEIKTHFPKEFFLSLPQETLNEIHLYAYTSDVHLPNFVFLSRAAPNAIDKLTNLTALTLNGFSLKPDMLRIISQKPELTFLSIANCSIRRGLPLLNTLTKLEHLNLTKVMEVDNNFLRQIADNCTNLKHLNLSKCITVGDTGVKHLHKLAKLEDLNLNDVFNITDAAIAGMHNLKKLECASCDSIYDEGIISLLKYSSRLEYLDVMDTGVSERILSEATRITKKRTNNLKLHLVVSSFMKNDWDEDEDYSPLLIIEGKEERSEDDSDSDFDVHYFEDEDDDEDYDFDDDEFDIYHNYDDYEYYDGDEEYELNFIRLL